MTADDDDSLRSDPAPSRPGVVGVIGVSAVRRLHWRRLLGSFPWLPDTAYGVMTAGLGRVVVAHRDELERWGWGFLEPLAWVIGPVMIGAGLLQALAALRRWHGVRRAAASAMFLLYGSIAYNTPSPTGH